MNLYNLKSAPNGQTDQFTITKFDADLNVESSYVVSAEGCGCPQGHKPTCRHRKMLPLFLSGSDMTPTHVDTAWFLDFETKQWHCFEPQGEPMTEAELVQGLEDRGYITPTPPETTSQQRAASLPWRRI